MELEKIYQLFIKANGISTDTRDVSKGDIFIALSGENFNGNTFAEQALEKGCEYAIVDDANYVLGKNYILVENCLFTLQELAKFHRQKMNIPVIAITGTNGKTTTKELISAVLSRRFNVISTIGNLNNHIGVPLTLLRITNAIEIAIIEMGANHPGEIDFLCSIALPNHGIITNIGRAHLEGFGGFEGVKQTKNELYKYLIGNDGTIFYNVNNTILKDLLSGITNGIKSYGNEAELLSSDPFLSIIINGKDKITTKLAGNYNLENVLAAIVIGQFFGVSMSDVKIALENYVPNNQRSQLKQTQKNKIIMDCYNANPSSMDAALNSFNNMTESQKVVILGDMLELGSESIIEHSRIVEVLQRMDLEKIILVGENFCSVSVPAMKCFKNSEELKVWLSINKLAGYYILLKGSRGIKLEYIVDEL